MLSVEQAQKNILDNSSSIRDTESIALSDSSSRVLALDIIAKIDVPRSDNSAMDGYAVNTGDVKDSTQTFTVSQRVTAGAYPTPLDANSTARVFTGADIPENANAVIMQENSEAVGKHSVRFSTLPKPGDNIRPKGQDITQGQCILRKGEVVRPQQTGLLASLGLESIDVFRRLRVCLVGTGDELIEPGQPLQAGQIYNSNQPMLEHFLKMLGCHVLRSDTVRDSYQATVDAFEKSADDSDLVISTGGVSVGEEDHVKSAVSSLGELDLWKVNIKPGKPLAFGKIHSTTFLGLPGNPVSTFVTFMLFAIPLIRKLQGSNVARPQSFMLPTTFSLHKLQSRPEYLRVRIENGQVEKFHNQSSGVLTSVCWANALALVPEHTAIEAGNLIEVFPFSGLINS